MKINGIFAGVAASVLAYVLVTRLVGGGVAPVPPGFDKSTTLDAALARAATDGKPVVALVTADWCGPCQALKRGSLADPQVAAWIRGNALTAYVDGTESSNPDLARLRIEAFPTMVMINKGQEVARLSGDRETALVLAWLKDSAAKQPAASPGG